MLCYGTTATVQVLVTWIAAGSAFVDFTEERKGICSV